MSKHHPIAQPINSRIEAPISNPRMDSITGVIGWLLAIHCSHSGIVSVLTKALER